MTAGNKLLRECKYHIGLGENELEIHITSTDKIKRDNML